jgi:hypothetical protein
MVLLLSSSSFLLLGMIGLLLHCLVFAIVPLTVLLYSTVHTLLFTTYIRFC